MAVTFVAASSSWVSGTSAVTPGTPAGVAAGDLVIIALHSKYDNAALASVPPGWTDGGAIANSGRPTGNDTGNTRTRVLYKTWESGDSMPSLSPANNNVSMTQATAYRSATGFYDIDIELLADNTTGSAFALVAPDAMGLIGGDMVHAGYAINGDAPTFGTPTIGASISGITWGTATGPTAGVTTSGSDMRAGSWRRPANSGTATGTLGVTITLGGTTTNAVGTGFIMRIREDPGPPNEGEVKSVSIHGTMETPTSSATIEGGTAPTEVNSGRAQSFTPTKTGPLLAVTLEIFKTGNPTDDLVVTIRDALSGNTIGSPGTINGTVLGTATGVKHTIPLTDVTVTSGVQYFMEVTRSGARNTSNTFGIRQILDGAYTGGHMWFTPGTSWSPSVNVDLFFQFDVPRSDYDFTGSATGEMPAGDPPNAGSASGTYAYAGSASGSVTRSGSGTGTHAYAGTASGARTSSGSATGGYLFAGSGLGSRVSAGQASGSYVLTDSGVLGSRASAGGASASHAYDGSATGEAPVIPPSEGTSSGSYAFAGTATGVTPPVVPNEGAAAGSYTLAGSTSGERDSSGSATGSYAYSGTGAGVQPPTTGSGSGSYAFAGSAAGSTTRSGAASGTYAYSGTASGAREATGTASGGYLLAGTASGARSSAGAASGDVVWTSFAQGGVLPEGEATGSVAYSGSASGQRTPMGSGTGSHAYTGTAQGSRSSAGAASGTHSYSGGGVGARESAGTASGTLSYSATGTGTAESGGSAIGGWEFARTETFGSSPNGGSATGSHSYDASAEGAREQFGTGAGSYEFTGTSEGVLPASGTAFGTAEFHGHASGTSEDPSVGSVVVEVRWSASGKGGDWTAPVWSVPAERRSYPVKPEIRTRIVPRERRYILRR